MYKLPFEIEFFLKLLNQKQLVERSISMKESKIVRLAIVCLTLIFLVFLGSSAAQETAQTNADAESESLNAGLNADLFSGYIWRGQRINKDWVFQPSVDLGYKTLSASIWGNIDLTNSNDQHNECTEIDYTLEQSDTLPIGEIEGLNYSLGAIHYTMHGNDCENMTEVFWGFGYDCPLNPSIKVYHDTDKASRTYIFLAVEHSFDKIAEISPEMPVGMDIGAGIGWGSGHYNNYYWETDGSGLNDLNFKVSFPVEIAEGWTITPSVNYTTLLCSKIRDSDAYSTKSDYIVAGLSLSKSF